MPEETLILKRNPDAEYLESYNVLFEGRYVGRIYEAVSHAPREAPWFWGVDFFEWQGSDGPQYGDAATLEVRFCAVLFGTYKMLIITSPMLII